MMRTISRVALVVAAAALSAACAGGGGTTTASSPTSAPTATVTPAAAPTPTATPDGSAAIGDGRHPVYLTTVDVPGRSITFDLVRFLTGDEAKAEWLKLHPDEPGGPPNDYIIVNENPQLRTVPVAADVMVGVVKAEEGVDPIPLPFADLPTYHPGPISTLPFWITVRGGVVTSIEEQYVP